MVLPKNRSVSSPQAKPISMPSKLPRMNPKENTKISSRFGTVITSEEAAKMLFCTRKTARISSA